MNIDIIYRGFLSCFFVKAKSFAFFSKYSFINRNNVFISNTSDQIFHIKSNSISIYFDKKDETNIDMLSKYLKYVFNTSLFGIKTDDELIFIQLKTIDLNVLRM